MKPIIAEQDKTIKNKVVFVSFNKEWPLKTAGRNVIYYYDLVSDLIYEIGAELAFKVKDIDIQDKQKLILDFKEEKPDGYMDLLNSIILPLKDALFDVEINEQISFKFPESYVEWLRYNSDALRQQIGEKLILGGATITLSPKDIYDEYISAQLVKDLREYIMSDSTVSYVTVVDTKVKNEQLKSLITPGTKINFLDYSDRFITSILGDAYRDGIGVVKDDIKAFAFYEISAQGGHPYSQHEVGDCYFYGRGISENKDKAFKWYYKGAENGNLYSCAQLGYCYHLGIGTEKNLKEAVKWYEKSNQPWTKNNLGNIYFEGIEGTPDYVKAFENYKLGAEQNAYSLYRLGYMYLNGLACEKDETKAFELLKKAADAGRSEAYSLCLDLAKKGVGNFGNKIDYEDIVKYYSLISKTEGDYNAAEYLLSLPYTDDLASFIESFLQKKSRKEMKDAKCMYFYARLLLTKKSNLSNNWNLVKEGEFSRESILRMGPEIIELLQLSETSFNPAKELHNLFKSIQAEEEKKRKEEIEARNAKIREEELKKEEEKKRKENEKLQRYNKFLAIEQNLIKAIDLLNCRKGTKDRIQAIKLLINGVKEGIPEAMAWLGFTMIQIYPDNKQYFKLLSDSIKKESDYYLSLSEAYLLGKGTPQDRLKGTSYVKRAYGDCYALLGICYINGIGVDKDLTKGIKYLETSISKDNGWGYSIMGLCYQVGLGKVKDEKEAKKYYALAQKQNIADAYNFDANLDMQYAHLFSSYKQAAYTKIEKAAKLGSTMGMLNYGALLAQAGHNAEAEKWLNKAIVNSEGNKEIISEASRHLRGLGALVPDYKEPTIPLVYFDEKGFPTLTKPLSTHIKESVKKEKPSAPQISNEKNEKKEKKGFFKKLFGG